MYVESAWAVKTNVSGHPDESRPNLFQKFTKCTIKTTNFWERCGRRGAEKGSSGQNGKSWLVIISPTE